MSLSLNASSAVIKEQNIQIHIPESDIDADVDFINVYISLVNGRTKRLRLRRDELVRDAMRTHW